MGQAVESLPRLHLWRRTEDLAVGGAQGHLAARVGFTERELWRETKVKAPPTKKLNANVSELCFSKDLPESQLNPDERKSSC
jgi:hypothetical protein